MVWKVNLYKNDDLYNEENERIGTIIVGKTKKGIIEVYSNRRIEEYITVDQTTVDGKHFYFPQHEAQKKISDEIEKVGYSLFVLKDDLVPENEVTREDLDFFRENPSKYSFNIITKNKTKIKQKK